MWQNLKNIYHYLQGLLANIIYGFPSRRLKVIGVTGTDGKTTTTTLIFHILQAAGKKASMISTVYAKIGGKVYDTGFHVTTPSVFAVQKYLRLAADNGDQYFVLETTSHALDQHRILGVQFAIGVITNITHEHLNYHKTYENYVKAKVKLLQASRYSLTNRDDISYSLVRQSIPGKIHTYGIKNKADYSVDISVKAGIPLAEFNQYNYLAAYAVCKQLKLSDEQIFPAMKTFKLPPGRMDTVYDQDFTAIIDFAHTPNAIHEALKAIKFQYPNRRLIHVFGSASERDDSKRPFMGEESGEFADLVIITEEDYRKEDPQKIAQEIAVGLHKKGFSQVVEKEFGTENKTYTIINDRKSAVNKAIGIAQPGDVIVFTGKGHEQSLCRGKTEYPWDEKQAVLHAINNLKKR